MDSMIETALPLSQINARTLREKKLSPGHPANMHLWWGRSPVSSVRAALKAALTDAHNAPTVLDPFCGFGGIPLAAQSLGLSVVSSDLNPVAVMLTKAATEIPARFLDRAPVNPSAQYGQYSGAEGLAHDVAYYGALLQKKAWEKLSGLYPNEPDGTPSAWIWARTVKCPNPACGCMMPLASSLLLYSVGKTDVWAQPVAHGDKIEFEIHSGHCPDDARTNKVGSSGAKFRCPICSSLTTDDYVRRMGQRREIGTQMMAIVLETQSGTQYISPTVGQLQAADVPIPDDAPPGELPEHDAHFTPYGYGFKNYADLFSPRQLTLLTTLCDLLPEIQDRAASDALAAGMPETGGSLSTGGAGALAYGQAIGVYLALAVDKLTDTNSTCCTLHERRRSYRSTFGRQAIPMAWTYVEGNPFYGTTRNFDFIVDSVSESIRNLTCASDVRVSRCDARTAEFPSGCMVCTELPYYKKIAYAQLSDYFYIWLRKSLKAIYPDLFDPMVTNKDELSTCNQDAQLYEAQMQDILMRLAKCADSDYPQLFFFEFHKGDEQALAGNGGSITPWETLIGSMLRAGYAITAVWPMRSAAANEKSDGTRVLIVARVRGRTEQTTRRGFASALKQELPATFSRMLSGGVDACDEKIVGMGAGLSIFTRYKRVLNASGSDMNIHDALVLIYQEVMQYLTERNMGSECDTAQLEEE